MMNLGLVGFLTMPYKIPCDITFFFESSVLFWRIEPPFDLLFLSGLESFLNAQASVILAFYRFLKKKMSLPLPSPACYRMRGPCLSLLSLL